MSSIILISILKEGWLSQVDYRSFVIIITINMIAYLLYFSRYFEKSICGIYRSDWRQLESYRMTTKRSYVNSSTLHVTKTYSSRTYIHERRNLRCICTQSPCYHSCETLEQTGNGVKSLRVSLSVIFRKLFSRSFFPINKIRRNNDYLSEHIQFRESLSLIKIEVLWNITY